MNEGLIEGREMCGGSGEEGRLYEDLYVRVKRERYMKGSDEKREVIEGTSKAVKLYKGLGSGRESCMRVKVWRRSL